MRALVVAVTLSVVSVACAGDGDAGSEPAATRATTVPDYPDSNVRFLRRLASEPRPVPNSALPPRHLDEERFPVSLVRRDRIVWGGVAPDAIAPLEEPTVEPVAAVDWLEDDEAVLVLRLGDRARAYPVQLLLWHEIVNDRLAGRPVTVTYCPLCNSGVAFDRRLDGRVLDFGTSGSLHRSALVMYDRQTESLWTHFDGRAVVGDLVGAELEQLAVSTVSWADFAAAHPDGDVVSRDTGYDRPYGVNRYTGYDQSDRPLSGWFTEPVDDRFAAFARVVGIDVGDRPVAVMTEALAEAGVVGIGVDGREATVWHLPGTASPLEADRVADGNDVGATGVFLLADDGPRTFSRRGAGFVDAETGSRWNILGEAVDGPLTGRRLDPVPHLDTFWFAWSVRHPDGDVIG